MNAGKYLLLNNYYLITFGIIYEEDSKSSKSAATFKMSQKRIMIYFKCILVIFQAPNNTLNEISN